MLARRPCQTARPRTVRTARLSLRIPDLQHLTAPVWAYLCRGMGAEIQVFWSTFGHPFLLFIIKYKFLESCEGGKL